MMFDFLLNPKEISDAFHLPRHNKFVLAQICFKILNCFIKGDKIKTKLGLFLCRRILKLSKFGILAKLILTLSFRSLMIRKTTTFEKVTELFIN